MSELVLRSVAGPDAECWRAALAALRITVFREYPYLYDGSEAYEREYLQRYFDCPECVFVLAWDGDRLAGASTGLPMRHEVADFRRPFEAVGLDPGGVFYFGESMLLPDYRGRGVGHRFFDEREAWVRGLGGFRFTAFCAVVRPAGHPLRPADYRPHDDFWAKRGYRQCPELATSFEWKDLDEATESPKRMVFWIREWA